MTKEERYMTQALALAGHAAAAEDIPVGCVVVKDGAVIGQGYNRRVAGADAIPPMQSWRPSVPPAPRWVPGGWTGASYM